MRKDYIKPAAMVEKFVLSDYIASGCDNTISSATYTDITTGCLPTELQTLYNMPRNYFVDALACSTDASSDNNTSGYCYYTYANSIFTS
ncbi:MAG: hypothetical protein ACI4DS_04510 [Eubacterium sp.]